MSRINVVGSSASGKSTFSKALAKAIDHPYIEMDALIWQPNWQVLEDEDFFPLLSCQLEREKWILDGNYTRTIPIKWQNVDCVIWLDYSFCRTFYQSFTRAVKRTYSGKELWEGTGNVETFRRSFMSKDSIILWMLKNYKKRRKTYLDLMKKPKYSHIKFVRITSPKMAEQFIEEMSAKAFAYGHD